MKVEQLLNITLRLKGLQLDQLRSLTEGSDDPDDYNPNALAQIESALTGLYHSGFIDEDDFHDIIAHSQMMREAVE